jgi:hypothetical protein
LAASKRESASSIFPGGSGCFSSNRNFHNESRAWLTSISPAPAPQPTGPFPAS